MENLLGQISWTTFISSLIVLLLIYYTYLAYTYYSEEIQGLLKPKVVPGHNPFHFAAEAQPEPVVATNTSAQEPAAEHLPFEQESDEVFERIEAFVEEIKPTIRMATQGSDNPDHLKATLTDILSKYPDLGNSPYKPALNEMIQTACKNTAFITLSEEETAQLWPQR